MENEVEPIPLLLRPLQPGDQPLLDELNADQVVMDYFGKLTFKGDDGSTRLRVISEGTESKGVLGLVQSPEKEVHFICALLPHCRGKHIGPRACVEFLTRLREEREFPRVLATISPRNEDGLKLAELLSFQRTGKVRYNVTTGENDELWELRC